MPVPNGVDSYLSGDDVSVIDPNVDDDQDERDRQEADQLGQPAGYIPQAIYAPAPVVASRGIPPLLARPFAGQTDYFDPDNPPAAPPGPVTPPAPPAPPSTKAVVHPDAYGEALKRLEEATAKRPVMSSPKWWQRLLAGAAGGAAGWTNAASRIRNPLDIAAVQENILHPGYANKLQEWQSRVAPLQQAAEIEGQRAAAAWKNQQIQTEQQLKTAQAQAALDRGAYWKHRAQTESNHYRMDAHGNVIDLQTGKVVSNRAPTTQELYDEAIRVPGTTPEEARNYALSRASGGKYTAAKPPKPQTEAELRIAAAHGDPEAIAAVKSWDAEKAATARASRNPPDPLVDVARQALIDKRANDDLDAIGRKKVEGERDIKYKRQQAITAVQGNPNIIGKDKTDRIAEINRAAAAALQNIENEYRGEGRRRNIPSNNVIVDPKTLEYTEQGPQVPPPQTPSQTPGRGNTPAKTYTEADVRQRATAAKKDPDAAVRAARAKGLIQ